MRKNQQPRERRAFSLLKAMAATGGTFPTVAELDEALRRTKPGDSPKRESAERKMTILSVAGAISAGFGESGGSVELGEIPVDLQALNISPHSRTFALRVRGDSMVGALIADGDMVVVEAREPKIGEIVAALIDGETTLKRFVTKDGALFLRAENPRYPDLIPVHQLTIQGVVRAVVRVCDRPRPIL